VICGSERQLEVDYQTAELTEPSSSTSPLHILSNRISNAATFSANSAFICRNVTISRVILLNSGCSVICFAKPSAFPVVKFEVILLSRDFDTVSGGMAGTDTEHTENRMGIVQFGSIFCNAWLFGFFALGVFGSR
jgi:hypothetical protein